MARLTREHDEMILDWMAMRAKGVETIPIGIQFGVTAGYVRSMTNRVVNADAELHKNKISFKGSKK